MLKKDATLLERGKHTPYEGVNLITLDVFDAGLTGDQALFLLESVKRNVTASSCAVVPARRFMCRRRVVHERGGWFRHELVQQVPMG